MKKRINFFKNFIKDPLKIGSITPSSRYLAERMISDINFSSSNIIIEYGPGEGVFSKKIIERMSDQSIFILIELNEDFYRLLKETFKNHKNVYIFNDNVCNVKSILNSIGKSSADYIVSGIPFSSIPKKTANKILYVTQEILTDKGLFITFQYSKLNKKLFNDRFLNISIDKVWKNLPPANVIKCRHN